MDDQKNRDDLAGAVAGTPKLPRNAPRIERMRRIVATKTAARTEGQLVDLYTASVMVKVYEALNDANRAKLDAMPLQRAVGVAYKAVVRARGAG